MESRRYFVEDSEIFHANGKTYVFSKMWGKGTQSIIEILSEKYSQLEIEIDWD